MDLISARTAPMPRVLWIELSSRCPFDCIFCTRASLRGAGELLDLALYRRLIGELERPQIIRLNYAGESGHYPQLAEAVALAAATGADVELVSALASLKPGRLQAALDAGLTRLTVSLHTLDAGEFDAIYRFSSLAAMHQRLQQVLDWRRNSDRRFLLDLAFVAMQRNLAQLPAIAAFAAEHGIEVLAVHPLIGRDPLPLGTATEHTASGTLHQEFRTRLEDAVAEVRQRWPQVAIQLSSHELSAHTTLSAHPKAWPWPMPEGAVISTCDQSPFDSVHVLADGRVIACEVTEKMALGDLRQQSLREIWNGPAYRAFRERHRSGAESACRSCVYKRVHQPQPASVRIEGRQAPAEQLLSGWHSDDGSGVRWSSAEATLWLPRVARHRRLHLHGMVAPTATPAPFSVHLDGLLVHQQTEAGPLQLRLPLPPSTQAQRVLQLRREGASSPHALGTGADLRELGFALILAETR
ncbi:MAG: SPASM domain-containing protein [Lysobacterales bacterium]